tara:strand:- start:250 stop:954 length:705 start_codon:yes stop_codon:yes gene_type:complete
MKDFVFVIYVPGSFGSFLSKTLELSDSVANRYTNEAPWFDDFGAAHKSLNKWITNFHHGDDLNKWIQLDPISQKTYVASRTAEDAYTTYAGFKKIHRFTIPKQSKLLESNFPLAQFVTITFDKTYLPLIAKQMATKTYKDWQEQVNMSASNIVKVLKLAPFEVQQQHYLKICTDRILECMDDSSNANNTFDLKSFFNRDTYFKKINLLCSKLNIQEIDETKLKIMHDKFMSVKY